MKSSSRSALAPLAPFALASLAATAVLTFLPVIAEGAVTHAGTWPSEEKPVSVDIKSTTRAGALNELADAAGWSLVVRGADEGGPSINLHVAKQPPSKVLDLILADVPGTVAATRDGQLISLTFLGGTAGGVAPALPVLPVASVAPTAPTAPALPAAAAPVEIDAGELAKLGSHRARGEDREVNGGSLRIDKGETVHDVSIFGGNLEVYGTVTGSISVLGGSAHLFPGAHLEGSANILGGKMRVDDTAVVDGDVGVLGGSVTRAPGAILHGSIKGIDDDDDENDGTISAGASASDETDGDADERAERAKKNLRRDEATGAGFSVSAAALLFVFGALLLAFAPRRVAALRTELIAHPFRSLGVGVVSLVALGVLTLMLFCTLLGIPVALVILLGIPVVMLCGGCAILTTVGGALLQHRSSNPNVHLAAGCALLFLLGLIPVVGFLVHVVVALAGLGVMVTTRAAGLVTRPTRETTPTTGMPYR